MNADPFAPTPPTPAEQEQVTGEVALLHAAADKVERQIAEGKVAAPFAGMVAVLRDEARSEVGGSPHAVALARDILAEGER